MPETLWDTDLGLALGPVLPGLSSGGLEGLNWPSGPPSTSDRMVPDTQDHPAKENKPDPVTAFCPSIHPLIVERSTGD